MNIIHCKGQLQELWRQRVVNTYHLSKLPAQAASLMNNDVASARDTCAPDQGIDAHADECLHHHDDAFDDVDD